VKQYLCLRNFVVFLSRFDNIISSLRSYLDLAVSALLSQKGIQFISCFKEFFMTASSPSKYENKEFADTRHACVPERPPAKTLFAGQACLR